jgi:outer membrane protein, heavy metal efflux system
VVNVVVFLVASCGSVDVPPEETAYYREQVEIAQAAPRKPEARVEAQALREAAGKLEARGAAEAERIRRAGETEGLLDVESPDARAFLAELADPTRAEDALGKTLLSADRAYLAAYALNPDVAAARASWAASVRMYEQASYLEDLLLRYGAFTRFATQPVAGAAMREAAFPYPGLLALKGEMVDREVAMAREMARMRLRDVLVAVSKSWHEAVHHVEELRIREDQLSIAKRMVETARVRVASGTSPQAELLEMESEVAMAENDRQHALTSLARARAELSTLLGRDPSAPLVLPGELHEVPTQEISDVQPLLELAHDYSPEIRIARAEVGRTAAAIRMAEAMLFAPPAPGAVVAGATMSGASSGSAATQGMDTSMDGGAQSTQPGLPPRDPPPAAAPGAFGADVAWVAELRERHASLQRALEETIRATERRVISAHYELEAQRRMYLVAAKSTEPLAAQAVEERLRLYESGRAEFAELMAAFRRHLDAAHDAVAARHDFFMADAMLWMAIGARPEVVASAGGPR